MAMMRSIFICLGLLTLAGCQTTRTPHVLWSVDSAAQWTQATGAAEDMTVADGLATPTADTAVFRSIVKRFDTPQQAVSLILKQSPVWDNWQKIPNFGPPEARDAPVFLPIDEGNYWFFAEAKDENGRGYHAWHSTDLKTWRDKGLVNREPHRWITTAEYADGRIYVYMDKPNDEDPHLFIASNLDGELAWDFVGKVFDDPSHGSDAGVIRTRDGTFHLIYEDWSPINARRHSWDSPLTGHADSPDGIRGFAYGDNPPIIDHRTTPTGRTGTYRHPNGTYQYEVHEPEQNAYGDYTLIQVGQRFYLFCDHHPAGGAIGLACFTGTSWDKPFQFVGRIGVGHPDPTVGFAEGKFYLVQQRADHDFVSPGPWNETVEARAGVDSDNDGQIDQWTEWQAVRETYRRKPGFARVVDVEPAELDLNALPAGYGFTFEFRTTTTEATTARPIMDRVSMVARPIRRKRTPPPCPDNMGDPYRNGSTK
jgi:hypothetical protein